MKWLSNPWALLVVAALLAAIFFAAWMLSAKHCDNYVYINQDIACGAPPVLKKTNYLKLRNDITAYIAAKTAAHAADEVAVYFRDLRDGPVFGINAGSAYAPASLLKLPMAMTFMALGEEHPEVLDAKLRYSREEISKKYDLPEQINYSFEGNTLLEGGTYAVRDLMRASIVYSDNVAYMTLVDFINTQYPGGTAYVLNTFQDLGVIDPRTPEEETVTVSGYSSLFRLLYNAAFLSAADSEQVLAWMRESSYDPGLAAGVPEGVVVANKFGERQVGDVKRLHDCGIIYYPGNPYSLCIMTQGSDWEELKAVISDISHMVYQEVDSRAR